MTPDAPQPPIPEPDAACDPHRGEPTRKRGLQHTIHCVTPNSKNKELWLRKPWEKRAGWILIHPARPRPAVRRSLRCETSALSKSLQLRPRNRRVDAAAQATVRRRHDTLVAHNIRELADTLSHQLRVLHNVRRV